jgi:hypothetical protein
VKCLANASRALEVGPASARMVVRPLSTSLPGLGYDRTPSRRGEIIANKPASMHRTPKASRPAAIREEVVIRETNTEYPELPNEKFVESWTVSHSQLTPS